jgi:hypothetical protein
MSVRSRISVRRNAALVLLGAALAEAPDRAQVVQVPSQYPTGQAGIDATQNGWTMLVANGMDIRAGNHNMDSRITVDGEV